MPQGREINREVRRRWIAGSLAAIVSMIAGSSVPAQDRAATGPTQFEGKDCLTSGCHAVLAEPKYVHGPMAVRACQWCHEETDRQGHKYRMVAEAPALCFACHVKVEAKLKNQTIRPYRHKPVVEGRCLECHNPHASGHPKMLRKDSVVEFCMGCHKEKLSLAGHVHKVIEEKGCLECHRGHDSDQPKLLRQSRRDLCLRCHADKYKAIMSRRYVHKPVKERNCVGCHTPHASPASKLLVKRFSAERYLPFDEGNYELCFSCHKRELAVDRVTTTHTNFRNGERNLHYLHVNKESKGRSCRICHLPHSSSQPRLIRPHVPFGEWELNIRYVPTKTGGYCGPACHSAKRYDRLIPVDLDREPVVPGLRGAQP